MTDAATSELTYADRIELLRQRKLRQTAQKIAAYGPMDEDDYSTVVPPEGFQWRPIPNHPNGSFYGARGWGDNFRSLMEVCPVYVDPADAIAGRVVFFLSRLRGKLGQPNWLAECDWPHLRAEQDLYNVNPGIGSDTHFGGDYRIGLKGRVDRIDVTLNPALHAEDDVLLGLVELVGIPRYETHGKLSVGVRGDIPVGPRG